MRQNLSRGVAVAAAATGFMSLYASPAFADSKAAATAADSPGVLSGNNIQVPVNVPVNLCGNTVDIIAALNPSFGNSCVNGGGSHGPQAAPHRSAHETDPGRGRGGEVRQGGAGHAGGGYGGHDGRSGHGDSGYGAHGGYGGERAGSGHGGSGYGGSGYGGSGYGDSGYGDSGHGHSGRQGSGHGDSGGHHGGRDGSSAYGGAYGSPGVLSGNHAEIPVDVPVEVCGNSVNAVGLGNPAFGNQCGHHHGPEGHATTPHAPCTHPHPPRAHEQPPTETPFTPTSYNPPGVREQPPAPPVAVHRQYTPPQTLAETGGEGLFATSAASAALLAGGALLYRRNRFAARP
ncbi:chaplin [Streptomyces sp. NPDC002580]|uniref:chaplin n=1 Tax=Streptomyces sp. NPDC002580 TaxID=3364653 RepID=UPI003684C657